MDSKTKIDDIKKEAILFRDERNWRQYHDPKNLAMALSIEAAELQELELAGEPGEVGHQELVEHAGGDAG